MSSVDPNLNLIIPLDNDINNDTIKIWQKSMK